MSEPLSGRYALSEKTSQTDDERIVDVTPLPPPEHLIRFFPIRGTPVETLVSGTRKAISKIVHGNRTAARRRVFQYGYLIKRIFR